MSDEYCEWPDCKKKGIINAIVDNKSIWFCSHKHVNEYMEIREAVNDFIRHGEYYPRSTIEMALIIEYMIIHDAQCKIVVGPSGNGSYFYRMTIMGG